MCLACPADALHLDGARVEFDPARCVNCGLCAAVCPTDVFEVDGTTDAGLLNAAAKFGAIEFACPRREDFENTRAPEVEELFSVPCLGGLSTELMMALAAEHPRIWLDDSHCATCPIGARTHPHIRAAVDAANEFLKAWNRSGAVRTCTEAAAELEQQPRALSHGAPQRVSRRQFLSLFTLNAGRAAAATMAHSLSLSPADEAAKPMETIFARALAKLGAPANEHVQGARVATIQVTEACTACGLCAKVCPTRAIGFQADAERFALTVAPRECLGTNCDLCELICPVDALALVPGITRDALFAGHARMLQEGKMAECARCGIPIASRPGQDLCYVCQDAEKKTKPADGVRT